MFKAILASFAALLLLASPVAAQTIITPGESQFEILPLILLDVPKHKGDYCGNPAKPETIQTKLNFNGDKNFLNTIWNVKDPEGIERQINVTCYLNCESPGTDIETNCRTAQMCNYLGPTGERTCVITNPNYNYRESNFVACKFYDLERNMQFLSYYPNATFWAVDYSISAPSKTVTVGGGQDLPVNVNYYGLLRSNFSVNITSLENGGVSLDRTLFHTDNLLCGEVVRVFPKVNFLRAKSDPYTFKILAESNSDPTTYPSAESAECSYLNQRGFLAEWLLPNPEESIPGKCWKRLDVDVQVGIASLPEYNFVGFIIVLFGAAGIFAWRRFSNF